MNVLSFLWVSFLFITICDGIKTQNQCPQIKIQNARIRYRQRGRIAKFVCNTGYILAGEKYSVCVHNQWDNTFPKCVRATCKSYTVPPNLLIYPSHAGGVLNFYCKSNYQLKGPVATYCDGNKWDKPLPTCLPSNTKPSLSCDFEDENICGWNHDLNHDFDWRRLNFDTPSGKIGTGPSYDHTKGAMKDGYYMYIESSSRNENDTARLLSPVYDKSEQNVCFEFYYHMFGITTGELRVYMKKISQGWNYLNLNNAVFVKQGNQGNKWYRGYVSLGPIDDDYQIIIEGVRGPGYVSDTAIDDVRVIQNCSKEEEIETTTEITISSEPPLIVESCEGRCNVTEGPSNTSFIITCDCDENCFNKNRCCPDYIDYCVQDTTTDDFITETLTESTTEVSPTTIKTVPKTRTTMKLMPRTSYLWTPTTRRIPPKVTTQKIKTTQGMKTTKMTTEKMKTTKMTTQKIKTTKMTTTQKTETTKTTRKEETSTNPVSTTKPTKSNIIYIKPSKDNYDDVEEVPFQPDKETEKFTPTYKMVNEKIIIDSEPEKSNTRTVIFITGIVFGVLFGLVGMAFLAQKYHLLNWATRRRIRYSSNGDSQSDVRFLTGDEILDFSLPRDYNEL